MIRTAQTSASSSLSSATKCWRNFDVATLASSKPFSVRVYITMAGGCPPPPLSTRRRLGRGCRNRTQSHTVTIYSSVRTKG